MREPRFLPYGLLGLQLILPVCRVAAFLAGMEFALYNKDAYVIVSAVVMVLGTLVLWIWGTDRPLFYLLLPPAALLNSFLWAGGPHPVVVFAAPVNALCAIALLLRRGIKWKKTVSVLCLLPALYLGFFGAVSVFFSGWVENTVVRELSSPDGGWTARVIDSQSLMDGDTLVTIQQTFRVNVLIGEFTCPEKRIYYGEWGEYQTMTIEWAGADDLIINGESYHVRELAE